MIRHRSLGQGFGCLLVGHLAQIFGRVPLYRYGGIGRIRVWIGEHSSRSYHDAVVRLEWHKEKEDAYFGDVIVTVFGKADFDAEVLDYLENELRSVPGFPSEAAFEDRSGSLPRVLEEKLKYLRMPPADVRGTPARTEPASGVVRLGLVGFSVAGEDEKNPGIERFPNALRVRLNRNPDRCFDVLYYKSDTDRKTISELIGDLVRSDLMLAFVGRKYLNSEYCMVELLEAARKIQPDETFDNPSRWPHRLWLIPMPDADALIGLTDKDGGSDSEAAEMECQEWKRKWVNSGANYLRDVINEFRGMSKANEEAPKKYVFDSWMRFAADGEEGMGMLLASLNQTRLRLTTEEWNSNHVEPLAKRVEEEIAEITRQLTAEERADRLSTLCRRHWNAGKREMAADAFEEWLQIGQPYSPGSRQEALNPNKKLNVPELEPIRAYWRERQCPK